MEVITRQGKTLGRISPIPTAFLDTVSLFTQKERKDIFGFEQDTILVSLLSLIHFIAHPVSYVASFKCVRCSFELELPISKGTHRFGWHIVTTGIS